MAETRNLTLEALQAETELLRERIAELEAALGCDFVPPADWVLTRHEAVVFGVLLSRSLATPEAIMAGLYRDLGLDEPNIDIVKVWISKLRGKLTKHGLLIETIWGRGYKLSPAMKALARAKISAAEAAAEALAA